MNVVRGRSHLGVPSSGSAGGRSRAVRRIAHGAPVALSGDATIEETVKQVAPYVKAALKEDATEDVQTLQARIRNHRKIRDSLPRGSTPWVLYDNKIQVLEARLRAAKKREGEEAEDRRSKWEWASLGKGSVITGILVGGAIIGFLLRAAGAQGAKRKFYRAQTKHLRRAS